MNDQFKIPADSDYLALLGRAFYNFTYLEWIVIWMIVKLSPDGFGSVPKGKKATAGAIAGAFEKAIQNASPPISASLTGELLPVLARFRSVSVLRNMLLHAHPFTAADGSQRLGYEGGHTWSTEAVLDAAHQFEQLSIEASQVFHGALSQERP